ncbi:MAG TPA: hypothetical protein DEQ64_08830 [Lachnoclostridium sp.]|nr:hypothetical protein [Lachnoclostridium sp.]
MLTLNQMNCNWFLDLFQKKIKTEEEQKERDMIARISTPFYNPPPPNFTMEDIGRSISFPCLFLY